MKIIELFDIDKFIKINNLMEVKSKRIYKSPNVFHEDGLFSEDIFGQTPDERKFRCGYIKLPFHVFNPDVARGIIMKSGGVIKKMMNAECRCNLVNGVLTPAADGKYCGLVDLYNIWDQIDIEKTMNTRSEYAVTILKKSPKRLIFNDKVLVCPPELRPVGMKNGKISKAEINTIYMQILGLKDVTAHVSTTNAYQLYVKMQNCIINLYTYINNYVGGKTGFFQKKLLAKEPTFAARNVISAPRYNTEKPTIGVFHTGYPMQTVCSLFMPFVRFKMKQILSYNNILNFHPNKNEVKQNNIMNIYDDRGVNDLIRIFQENPGSRFRILYLDPEKKTPIVMEYMDLNKNERVTREFTLADALYIAMKECVMDAKRVVYTVRYPIGDHLGAFFTYAFVLSTNVTTRIEFNGEVYEHYPVINPQLSHSVVSTMFADTVVPSNSRLEAIGGDYDGDTVKSVGIWSDEATARAEKLMFSKVYNIRPQVASVYGISKECLNGLYALTKRKNSVMK